MQSEATEPAFRLILARVQEGGQQRLSIQDAASLLKLLKALHPTTNAAEDQEIPSMERSAGEKQLSGGPACSWLSLFALCNAVSWQPQPHEVQLPEGNLLAFWWRVPHISTQCGAGTGISFIQELSLLCFLERRLLAGKSEAQSCSGFSVPAPVTIMHNMSVYV